MNSKATLYLSLFAVTMNLSSSFSPSSPVGLGTIKPSSKLLLVPEMTEATMAVASTPGWDVGTVDLSVGFIVLACAVSPYALAIPFPAFFENNFFLPTYDGGEAGRRAEIEWKCRYATLGFALMALAFFEVISGESDPSRILRDSYILWAIFYTDAALKVRNEATVMNVDEYSSMVHAFAGEKTPKELAQEKADTIMGPVSEVTSFQWAYGYEYGTVDDKMQSVLNVLSTPYFLSEGDPLLDKTARKIEWKVDNLVELKIGVTKIKNGPSESGVNVLRMNAVAEFPEPLNDISNDSSLADQIAAIFADYGFADPALIFDRDVNNDRAGKLLLINLELRATEPASASPKSMKSSKKTQAWHIFVAVALWADVSESYTGHAITNFIETIFGPLFAPLFNGSLF